MAKSDKTNPTGVTKIEPDKVLVLLEELIKIGKDTDYQEYLVSINERILDSQERTEKIGKEITKLIKDFEPIAAPIDSSPLNSIIKDMELIMDSYMEKTGESIKELIEFLRENEKTPQIVEVLKEEKEEQADILEDFLSQNEDQIQQNIDDMKEEEKKKFKDYDLVKKALGVVTKATDMMAKPAEKISDQAIANLIGPLQLVTQPLEDFFNINLVDSIKENMKTGFSNVSSFLFKKKDDKSPISTKDKEEEDRTASFLEQKIQPSKRDLLDAGVLGASAVYLADTFKDALMLEDKSGSPLGEGVNPLDGMSSMVPKAVANAIPGLLKGIGAASLVGGILMGVFDGILAAGKAEEWGVSKITASVAGFLGGASGEGDIKNAFANAGKFALIGVGIGTPFGPLGMLAGGVIGGIVGGILGWVGGENIAKFISWIGSGFTGLVDEAKNFIIEHSDEIIDIKSSITNLISPIVEAVKSVFSGIMNRVSNIKDILGDEETNIFEKITLIGKEVIMGIVEVPYNFIKGGLAGYFGDRWKTMSDILGSDETTLLEKISGVAKEIAIGLIEAPINLIKNGFGVVDNLIKLVLNDEWEAKYEVLKTEVASWFGLIIDPFVGGVKNFFEGWKERFGNMKDSALDKDKNLFEKVSDILGNLFLGIIEAPINYLSGIVDGFINSEKFLPLVDAIGSFFTNFGEAIKAWLWNILPDWAQRAVQGLGIGDDREVKEKPSTPSPSDRGYYTQATYGEVGTTASQEYVGTNQGRIEAYRNFNTAKTDEKETESTPTKTVVVTEKQTSGFLDFIFGRNKTTNVEDAIIYKDGKLIQPHPDDNIIATKENPFVVEKKETERLHNEIENNYFKESKDSESQKKFDTMISVLQVIADKIQSGGNVSVIENSSASGFDFNQLRIGASR